MGWKKVCFDLKQGQDFFPIWPWEGCPGHFHIKVMGMLVVSLWGACKLQILVSLRVFGMESYYFRSFRYRKEIYKKCPNTDHTEIPL